MELGHSKTAEITTGCQGLAVSLAYSLIHSATAVSGAWNVDLDLFQ